MDSKYNRKKGNTILGCKICNISGVLITLNPINNEPYTDRNSAKNGYETVAALYVLQQVHMVLCNIFTFKLKRSFF